MASCFIDSSTLINSDESKQACLKIYRDKDDKELSICFDNSLGAFKDEFKRIEAHIFPNKSSSQALTTLYITDSKELSDLINSFVNGFFDPA